MGMLECYKEWQNLKDWVWDDEELYITLNRFIRHFLAQWFDEFQINFNRDQYPHISRDDFNRLFEDSDELEVKEKDGTFYVTAVFYVNWDRKEDDPSKCIWTKKILNIVYRVDKPSPDVIHPIIQQVSGKTEFVEGDCQKAP
jgi:hypothetical protein